ncbi:Ca2+-dependent phosphoinositide-specific phospholipase C [Sphingomonas sp. 8AM]|uniref:Ca2+-dependent phosphoinositide-specific phospholipase C n=1 Tax=Sphingomonas sp. 8AM TaxID=2653170 RepID=UPI0012F084CA|nr:Ca2+-dependent phosphoinositide-specific phospholipase C [Sphingomonas sp. 8AM]VXC93185.1 Acid phosphatase [Sphingomonas sp. 8AM]
MWKSATVVAASVALSGSAYAAEVQCNLSAADARTAGAGCARAWMDHNLKLNDVVTVGTHNSYKTELQPAVLALLRAASPAGADRLDYRHRPLSEQLDAGARQLGIDVYADPQGGRFLAPAGLRAAGLALDPARRAALAEPGFKVMHVPDIDVLSACVTLRVCLGIVRRWSLAHPDHAPILLMFNAKSDAAAFPGGTGALPFDAAAFDALDREVRAVFPPQALITPEDVQGRYPTLRDAVLHDAWPTLGASRGKVLFALDEGPEKVALYRGARRALEGRVFFVNTDEHSPVAAYLTLNDPVADGRRIRAAVTAGFIVRTRADADTVEARRNDGQRRGAALASGAHFVSTDYLWPEPRFHNDYQVRLPQGAAVRCNPVRTAVRCAGLAVEMPVADDGGYLAAEAVPDGLRILPPPPAKDSPRAIADRQLFAATRRMEGSPRWKLATDDVKSDAFTHFACALGVWLTPQTAPAVARLLDRAGVAGVVDPGKRFYHVLRPYIGLDAPICEPKTEHLAGNGDYPSGHAANGWMEALILAELAPDRATEILARGRAYGESRLICGSHSLSAVQAGWLAGAAATAALHGSAAFRDDLEAARREMAVVRVGAPTPGIEMCRAEAAALAQAY